MPLNNQLRARHPAIKAYCRPGQFSSFPMLRCNSSWEPPSWVSAVWETENISNFRKIGKCHRSGRDCVIDGVTGVAGYGGDRAVDVVAHLWRGRIRISMRDVVCLGNISVSPLCWTFPLSPGQAQGFLRQASPFYAYEFLFVKNVNPIAGDVNRIY